MRFYNLQEMPFMHDEFSALFRTRFNSFNDLIEIGVRTGDTHPAGIQVFLWYYVAIVGENELLLKLPFVLMGIASIPLTYSIGKKWFNENVGLFSAVFIASTQYTLTYSVIIRPYISGLFFTLAMVYFWTNLIQNKTFSWKNALGYILFSVLSAYNHHFSLLFAFIVGITGLFVITKKDFLKYILTGIIIFVFYIPHLSIFFDQLGQGGLSGWLHKPNLYFVLNYVKYIFHFSPAIYILVVFVVYLSLLFSWTKKLPTFYIISVIWFVLPIAIGLGYSMLISPVIQYSMLIFSYPYFLFVVFGLFPKEGLNKQFVQFLILLFLVLNITTLIFNRKHYTILYQTRHLQFLKDINNLPQKQKAEILIANHSQITPYYQKKYHWDFNYKNVIISELEQMPLDSIQKLVEHTTKDYFVYGGVSYANPVITAIIKEKYPYCILKKDYYASNLYVFAKKASHDILTPFFEENYNFKTDKKKWKNTQELLRDTVVFLSSKQEWGPLFSVNLAPILTHKNNVIETKCSLELPSTKEEILLICEIKQKDSILHWSATSSNAFLKKGLNVRLYKTIELSGVHFSDKNIVFTTYLWNKNHIKVKLNNYTISIREGNPIQYTLYDPILPHYEK